jgi:hypothetical protein
VTVKCGITRSRLLAGGGARATRARKETDL